MPYMESKGTQMFAKNANSPTKTPTHPVGARSTPSENPEERKAMSKKKDFNAVNVKPHFLLLGFSTDMNTCDMALKNILMFVKNVTNLTKMFIQHVQALSRIEQKSSSLVENVIKSTPRRLAWTFTSTVSTRTSGTLNVLFVIKLLVVPRLLVHITDNATTFKLVHIVKSR